MRKINLFLASADRRGSNLVEAAVLDACFEQAAVECRRTVRLDELLRFGSSDAFQLIIVAADCLHAEPSRRSPWVSLAEVVDTIRVLKQRCSTPLLVFERTEANHAQLLQAGADAVLPSPSAVEALKLEVRRVLELSEPSQEPERAEDSVWTALLRGLRRRSA